MDSLCYRQADMIKVIVREVAEREGIKSPRELERATGLSYATCHALWNGDPRMIQLETIELACTRLGVRPGQLFEFEPDEEKLEAKLAPANGQKAKATKAGHPARKRKAK
jgi:DNA-binding Xre family transcriptional regulator